MGRGRAKAKQTKVARELKYRAGSGTDLDALRAELVHTHVDGDDAGGPPASPPVDDDDDPYADPYAVYITDAEDEADDPDDEDDEDDLARRWNVS